MGTWSTSILGDDSAMDVHGYYMGLFKKKKKAAEIRKKVNEKFTVYSPQGKPYILDNTPFWLGLAQAQWECNTLESEVLEIVKKIAEEEIDLQNWKDSGEETFNERKNNVLEFYKKIRDTKAPAPEKKKRIAKPKQKWIEYKVGDIIAIPITPGDDEFVFARITFEIKNAYFKSGLLDMTSHLDFFRDCILLQIYSKPSRELKFEKSENLINGIITTAGNIMMGNWKIVDHLPVDLVEVAFPECFSPGGVSAIFTCGEVGIKINIDSEDAEPFRANPRQSASLGIAGTCLYYLNRKDEIYALMKHLFGDMWKDPPREKVIEARSIADSDLRFSPHRDKVYELIKEDKNLSYYELAKKHGFDLERFYK